LSVARNEAKRVTRLSSLGLLLSVGVHAATFFALGVLPVDAAREENQIVEVSLVEQPAAVIEEPPPEPEPEAAPEPEPIKPPPKPIERAPKAPKEPPPEPEATPPAAAEETLADFSGTTLTGTGGWASAIGSGAPMNAPIGKANAAVTGRSRAGVQGGVIGGTGIRVVPEGDLSRRPQPPSPELLNAALERSYPKAARQQGIEGVARIRIRVLSSGKLQPLATLSETYPGFAEACKSSLRDVSFQPGLDGTGQPVATDIPYTCRFTVE
jgi:periplasmic protein TonB